MILQFEVNQYNGAEIKLEEDETSVEIFKEKLINTIDQLKSNKTEVIWIYLPISKSNFVHICVENGFLYHNADKDGLRLYLKLNSDSFIPGYATHYIGAGGIVIDDLNRILVIQEKYHSKKHFKLPGGALDPGEHIKDAVIREVLEETGIVTEFISLNCFRHWHGYKFGKSDIYFVCKLKPLSNKIIIDEREISKAVWMDVDEYLEDPNTHPFNRKIVSSSLNSKGLRIESLPNYGTPETHELMF